ncbi:hypothetical protein PMAYCL1PPCAC_15792, partial [Pristionchus mayeri]
LSGCFDLTADCVSKSHLCSVSVYDDVMNFYCKKTCNRDCSPFTTTTTKKPCSDLTPDCLNKRALCAMSSFDVLMTQFCPKTCGRCT